jgi:hypothetical protein
VPEYLKFEHYYFSSNINTILFLEIGSSLWIVNEPNFFSHLISKRGLKAKKIKEDTSILNEK